MKKTYKIALIVVMSLLAVLALVACSGKDVDSVAVSEANMPQKVFVVGNELDLSKGKLTVKRGEQSEEIPLTDKGVEVSGYDKNKLGTQEIQITYGGKSTTITVRTVERIAADGIIVDYFTGESLIDKGRFVVTEDDGRQSGVSILDPSVTVSGFSTAEAGNFEMTVSYKGKNTYETKLGYRVHEIAKYTNFTVPTKQTYFTHESLDLRGGRLTLANADGTVTREIELTPDMISGFDFSDAGPENMDITNALHKQLTVTYRDHTEHYNITVIFSDVSLIWLRVSQLEDVNWTEGSVEFSEEQKDLIIYAAEAYFGLTYSDKEYISADDKKLLLRAAAFIGLQEYNGEMEKFADVFEASRNGDELELSFSPDMAYGRALAAKQSLSDKNSELRKYAALLENIGLESDVAETPLFDGGATIGECLASALTLQAIDNAITPIFDYMTVNFDRMKSVPDDWSESEIDSYATTIENVYDGLIEAQQVRAIYGVINSWRANKDYFDILYTYYLNIYHSSDQNSADHRAADAALSNLSLMQLPAAAEEVYGYISNAFSEHLQLNQFAKTDATNFMFNFRRALDAYNDVMSGNDELNKSVLSDVGLLGFFESSGGVSITIAAGQLMDFMKRSEYYSTTSTFAGYFAGAEEGIVYGYDSLSAPLFSTKAGREIFDEYFDLFTAADSSDLAARLDALYGRFIGLTPTEQLSFLAAFKTDYSLSSRAFGADRSGNFFAGLVYSNLSREGGLSEEEADVFDELAAAYESFILRVFPSDTPNDFVSELNHALDDYNKFDANKKQKFDALTGGLAARCRSVAEMYSGGSYDDSGLTESDRATLEELKSALINLAGVAQALYSGGGYHATYYADYEHAKDVAAKIGSGSEALKRLYEYGDVKLSPNSETTANLAFLMQYNYLSIDNALKSVHRVMYDGNDVFLNDVYEEAGMDEFFRTSYPVFDELFGFITDSHEFPAQEADVDKLSAALRAFEALDIRSQSLLLSLDRGTRTFTLGMIFGYSAAMGESITFDGTTEGLSDLVDKLSDGIVYKLFAELISDYVNYKYPSLPAANQTPDTIVTKQKLKDILGEIKAAYAALGSEKEKFDGLLLGIYEKYVALVEAETAE